MKKFIVFSYDDYYLAGGINDIIGTADLLSQAIKLSKTTNYENTTIINRDIWETVWER